MRFKNNRKGFTIIELLIVVIVIGILAAAGLAKYQNFAELARKKTCLSQITTLENALAVWETQNSLFGETTKTQWTFSTRTGLLFSTALPGGATLGTNICPVAIGSNSTAAPTNFVNSSFSVGVTRGPLNAIVRDDKVWACPGAVSKYYQGDIRTVPDSSAFANPPLVTVPIGMGGRYFACVAGVGQTAAGAGIDNAAFAAGLLTSTAASNGNSAAPQVPFKVVLCGGYGVWGIGAQGATAVTPATAPMAGLGAGGAVGPDNSPGTRHSARW